LGPGRVIGLRLFPYPGAIGLAGLGRIMARVTGLRYFPYPGVIGLAGLSSSKTKTSHRADFSLIPQPRLG
jgi:hypothetical protein